MLARSLLGVVDAWRQIGSCLTGRHACVLQRLGFQLAPHRMTALVGRSGAGKSTVAALLAGFYRPQQGRISLGGVDLQCFQPAAWRDALAVVSQEAVLFEASIAANIAYAMDGRAACGMEAIKAAAEQANAHDFIEALPQGYDTIVGSQGVQLSGGQRQRISLARALLKAAPLIILDEATSALDAMSERLVQQAIKRLLRNRTVLVIAHRLATIQNADHILVLENGRIVEEGKHNELFQKSGHYSRLIDAQRLSLG